MGVLAVVDRVCLAARLVTLAFRAGEELVRELRGVTEDPAILRARGQAAGKAAAASSRKAERDGVRGGGRG